MTKGYSKVTVRDSEDNFATYRGYSILNKALEPIKIYISAYGQDIECSNQKWIVIEGKSFEIVKVLTGANKE